jgi:hypothetical protein
VSEWYLALLVEVFARRVLAPAECEQHEWQEADGTHGSLVYQYGISHKYCESE